MKLNVYNIKGKDTGEQVSLPSKIFGIVPNNHAIWMAVTAEMNNRRQGSSSTKNRSAVHGGGRKPWRQKGRGAARAGTIRSPLWVGGGRIFGPKPRNYHTKITKKLNRLARKSALSCRAKDDQIRIVEDFSLEKPKTKEMQVILNNLQLDQKKTLLLISKNEKTIWLSGRNIPKLIVREAINVSTADIINSEILLFQKSAILKINEVLSR